MDQALSIVLAGNYSATRSRIVRFPAYANEVKTLLNRALNLCAETIYDACELAFKLGDTELVDHVVRASLRPLIELSSGAFKSDQCCACLSPSGTEPTLSMRKETFRRAASAAATITGNPSETLGRWNGT